MGDKIVSYIGAIIIGTVSSLLCWAYSYSMYHNLVEHGKMELPYIANFVYSFSPISILIPIACIISGGLFIRNKSLLLLSISSQVSLVFGITWPILTIVSFQMPQTLM